MFCKKCGKKLPDNSAFCNFCGEKIYDGNTSDKSKNSNKNNKKIILSLCIALAASFIGVSSDEGKINIKKARDELLQSKYSLIDEY